MVCNVHYSLCRWDVSLGHAVEMEPECREEVLVGYVGVYIYIYIYFIYIYAPGTSIYNRKRRTFVEFAQNLTGEISGQVKSLARNGHPSIW